MRLDGLGAFGLEAPARGRRGSEGSPRPGGDGAAVPVSGSSSRWGPCPSCGHFQLLVGSCPKCGAPVEASVGPVEVLEASGGSGAGPDGVLGGSGASAGLLGPSGGLPEAPAVGKDEDGGPVPPSKTPQGAPWGSRPLNGGGEARAWTPHPEAGPGGPLPLRLGAPLQGALDGSAYPYAPAEPREAREGREGEAGEREARVSELQGRLWDDRGEPVRPQGRRWEWMRRWERMRAGYLDQMQRYGGSLVPGGQDALECLALSGRVWWREERGEEWRMRMVGYNIRDLSPLEGTYYCDVLASDAVDLVLGLLGAVRDRGVPLEHWGGCYVFTVPKPLSELLDELLGEDPERWKALVGKMYRAAWEVLERLLGSGIAGVVGMDYSGELAPWDPHYHLNFYVLPVRRRGDGGWEPLRRWWGRGELEKLREAWRRRVERIFGVALEVVDVKRRYCKTAGQAAHFIRYLFRHPLEDFWKGWRAFDPDTGEVAYKPVKGKLVRVGLWEAFRAFRRVWLIPKGFTRIRWLGFLSTVKRGEVLEGLGIVEVEEMEGKGWEKRDVWELVGWRREGLVFRRRSGSEAGVEVVVPWERVEPTPRDVVKRRKVWRRVEVCPVCGKPAPPPPGGGLRARCLSCGVVMDEDGWHPGV